jgi:hypothetical protein
LRKVIAFPPLLQEQYPETGDRGRSREARFGIMKLDRHGGEKAAHHWYFDGGARGGGQGQIRRVSRRSGGGKLVEPPPG